MNRPRIRRAPVTNSLDPANKQAYRRRARPLLFLGVMLFIVGLRGYLVPASADDTAAHIALGPVAYGVWHAGLTLSGLLLIVGLGPRLMPELEVIGLWAAMWSVLVHSAAILFVFGARATPTLALAGTLIWVLWGRLDDLRRLALLERRRHDAAHGFGRRRDDAARRP
jgi:hypothetical protein